MAFYWHPCAKSASPTKALGNKTWRNPSPGAASRPQRDFKIRPDRCGLPFTNRTFLRIPGRFCGTCACLGLEAHIIEPAGFPVTDRAFRRAGHGLSRSGHHRPPRLFRRLRRLAARRGAQIGAADHRRQAAAISTTPSGTTKSCCSAAKAPGCRKLCTTPPMYGSPSRSARGCARSTSRWRWQWWPAKRCGRPADLPRAGAA